MSRTEQNEVDVRLSILNTLLTTPHGELSKVYPVHQQMIQQDPLFYVRLAAWYSDTGEIRDHKEMFIINLCLSDFEGHRNVGLAMLRELPPYEVANVVNFIRGYKGKKITRTTTGTGKAKKTTATVTFEDVGLKRNIPRSVATEVTAFLREREAEPDWFDSTALGSRKSLKRLYTLLRLAPSERAQKVLFDEEMPENSSLAAVKALCKAEKPADQAQIIVDNRIPYRVASTVVTAMTPTVLLALIEVMSPQELINNLGSLKRRGAFDNAELKAAIEAKLDKAKKGKRVAAMKTSTAKKAVVLDENVQKKLDAVGDSQIKARGRIKRATALLVDKSQSMSTGIEIGKRLAETVSTVMDADLFVYAFDTMAYPIVATGKTLADWEKAFTGIRAGGGTSCGVGVEMLLRNKQRVEQIVMISDEEEMQSPRFVASLQKYIREMAITPHVVFLKCGKALDLLEKQCQTAGIEYDAYDFKGDYYGLPSIVQYLTKGSKMDLLMTIMSYELPVRKAPRSEQQAVEV